VTGLGTTLGRGTATNFQADLQTSDCILFMGSNMAEAHPVGFRFPMKARERGAELIHVDPHYTRTSAMCQQYVPLRAGTDIAFLGGLINYVLTHERWFREYVLSYTNATSIINDEFVDTEQLGGLFQGFDDELKQYDLNARRWNYKDEPNVSHTESPQHIKNESWSERLGHLQNPQPPSDPTLTNPNCVLNVLRRHFARYTPEMVAKICGCTAGQFTKVAESLCANSGRERTSAIVYGVGWTHHTTGVQIIRAAGILQLLLGNIGRPGGGIMAMRGHASIQGSTDIPTLYNLLPGYIPQPAARRNHNCLKDYLAQERVKSGYWSNFPKFMVSLLKAWYADAAMAENDWGFQYLPRIDDNYSHLPTFVRMSEGKVKGLFLFGQNPAAGAPNAGLHRKALKSLDWLVVRDWFEIESACFWYKGPENPDPKTIGTEIFFLPAAANTEKEGSFTNTERLLQWHDKAIDPPDDCRSDSWFLFQLGRRLKELYKDSTHARDEGLLNLTWDYERETPEILPDGSLSRIEGEPEMLKILKEINGYLTADGAHVNGFSDLKDDGSTACGCWIYSGVFPGPDRNRARSRTASPGSYTNPDWGFAWPHNRRVLYNRASADPLGRPWSERKKYVWWDEAEGKWTGLDEPDFEPSKSPAYRAKETDEGMDAIGGDAPFIMKPDGKGWLYAPMGTQDGPLPAHYEPVESPVPNLLYTQQENPAVERYDVSLNQLAEPLDPAYPVVATTYRLTEHYLSGPMSRFDSWLNELQPEMFIELSPELARARGIEHGGWMVAWNKRGAIEARAMVTERIPLLKVNNRVQHQIGIPFHWSFAGETTGGQANDLTSIMLDPNVSMHETKAFTCNVRAGRLEKPQDEKPLLARARPTREPAPLTPRHDQPEGQFYD
jgi:formate dehydrogenase major subunit